MHQRVFAIRSLGHDDLAVLERKPRPAGAELGDARLNEVLLHFGDRAEIGDDLLLKRAGNLVTAAAWLHPLPEMEVVVMLAGVVEEPGVLAERAFDDLFKRLAVPLGIPQQVVAVVDVSEMMLVVM